MPLDGVTSKRDADEVYLLDYRSLKGSLINSKARYQLPTLKWAVKRQLKCWLFFFCSTDCRGAVLYPMLFAHPCRREDVCCIDEMPSVLKKPRLLPGFGIKFFCLFLYLLVVTPAGVCELEFPSECR